MGRDVLYNGEDCAVKTGKDDEIIKENDKNRFKARILDNGEEVKHSIYDDNIVINYKNISKYLMEFD